MRPVIAASVRTHRGLRDENQDACLLWPRRSPGRAPAFLVFAGVFDGMGGHPGGREAGRLAAAAAYRALDASEHLEVAQRLQSAVKAAQDAVVAGRRSTPGHAEMAATCIVGATNGYDLRILWLGDSPAYLVRNNKVRRLTSDHVIETAAGPLVTRYLGSPTFQPDECQQEVSLGDRILLCSDGVTEMLDEDDLATLIGRATAEDGARDVIREAVRRGVSDNATAVVVAIGDPPGRSIRRALQAIGEAIGLCKI